MAIKLQIVFLVLLVLCSSFGEQPDGPYRLTATADQYVSLSEKHFPPQGPNSSRDSYVIIGPQDVDDSGHFSLRSRPNALVSEFTQEEIRRMDVVYVPPAAHLVPVERTVYFDLKKVNARGQEQSVQFAVTLLPLDQHTDHFGPRFKIANPTLTAPVESPVVNISRKYFEVDGFSDAHIQFMVVEEPAQGSLVLLHPNGSAAPLTGADEFSNVLVSQGAVVQYRQGTPGSALEDTFELMATDSQVEAFNRILLRFTSPPTSSSPAESKRGSDRPEVVSLQVSEGQRVVLASDYFSYALSGGGGRRDVTYTLMDAPVYGVLVLRVRPGEEHELAQGSTFRQDDANKGRLEYRAAPEIGLRAVTDRVPLTIGDSTGTRYRPQMLAITIAPEDNQAPIVTVNGDIEVREGGSEILPQKLITVSDPDSPNERLIFVLETPPTFGYLAANYNGAKQSPAGQFPVDALDSGSIKYDQAFHLNSEPPRDVLFFRVTDGRNRSPLMRLNVNIELVNDEMPLIMTETMEVDSGSGALIRNSSLYVSDFDTPPAQLVLTILQEASFGSIQRRTSSDRLLQNGARLAAGDSFTYQDVVDELIFFKPTPDSAAVGISHDSTVLSVTDGDFQSQASLSFNLTMRKSLDAPATQIFEFFILNGAVKTVSAEMLWTAEEGDAQFILMENLRPGLSLQTKQSGRWISLRQGDYFSTSDVLRGFIRLKHESGFDSLVYVVKLRVERENQFVGARIYYVKVNENLAAPWVDVNTGLEVPFSSTVKVNVSQLSAFDLDSDTKELRYKVLDDPVSGWFEVNGTGRSQQWTQNDLEAGKLKFHHSGKNDVKVESLDFEVTDGRNTVPAKMSVQINGAKEQKISIPMLQEVRSIKVNSGSRVKITQFELLVTDDTATFADLLFDVTLLPEHGKIEIQRPEGFVEERGFSMLDVLEGRVFYLHKVERVTKDQFQLILSVKGQRVAYIDETTRSTLSAPIIIPVEIIESNGPILLVNSGLDYLQRVEDKVSGFLSIKHLDAVSNDTPAKKLTYTVTKQPNFGLLYTTATFPESPTSVFTQDDVNAGRIYYHLDSNVDSFQTKDEFSFEISDADSKTLSGNIFRIQWAWINVERATYNVSETSSELYIKIVKNGGFIKDSTSVECAIVDNSIYGATRNDVQLKHSMVQFDNFDTEEFCVLQIKDNQVFQGKRDVMVEIFNPSKAILGPQHRTQVSLYDEEDRPQITFRSRQIIVEEDKGPLKIEVFRSGDLSFTSFAICSTIAGSAKGDTDTGLNPDFISRTKSAGSSVIFVKESSKAICEIDLIDDSLYEHSEDFYVLLSEPDHNSALGAIVKLKVVISGPNDVSLIYFSQEEYAVKENSGTFELAITRVGSDLSYISSVWCTTQPIDARPNEDYVPISQQVMFDRGESENWCRLSLIDDSAEPSLEGPERLHVILSSPEGSLLSDPSRAVVVIDDTTVDIPTFEFQDSTLRVYENETEAQVMIVRHGDTSVKASVKCFTRERKAKGNEDYVERPRNEESRVIFDAGQETANCTVVILDNNVYEGEEGFILGLSDPVFETSEGESVALIGDRAMMRVFIEDNEDAPKVAFDKKFIIMDDDEYDSKIVTVRLHRKGDISAPAVLNFQTRDGSAKSGSDYHPVSRQLTIPANVDHAEVNLTVYASNSEDSREERFYLTVTASDGNDSKEVAIIVQTKMHEAIVLPSQPVVVSLLNYDNASTALGSKPVAGYPVVCITPCEERHPHFQSTRILCEGKNMTMQYFWEVAIPNEWHPLRYNPFKRLSKATIFTDVEGKVLDPVYFNTHFNVRCGVQPMKPNGRTGIPIKSQHVTIGSSQGICRRDEFFEDTHIRSHVLNANLFYVNASAERHPNTVHIKIEIPHSDGMLPLISTQPLHNAQTLLTDPLYVRHHTCSNLLVDSTFLKQTGKLEHPTTWPYQLDESLRGHNTVELYRNLDIRSCLWKFNAWFHMTELLDFCHGKVISEFKVADGGKSQMTIEVPLYVSYITSSGAEEWTTVEHRTAMEVSFLYSPLAWHKGLQTETKHSANVKITRVLANENGQLVIELTTHALFRGHFVLTNHKHKSSLMPPREMANLNFRLDLLWSETTWDGPRQQWRATSDSSRPDYSGLYHLMLVPCTVAQNTQFSIGDKQKKCSSHPPVQFPLNINFKMPARPVPAKYALETEFRITNNPNQFIATPEEETYVNDEAWQFSPGDIVYGKVMWHPAQDLKSAYRLTIDRVLLCTAKDGAELMVDPAGEYYGHGTQIGCLQPSKMLAHRFVLLDRENPEIEDDGVQGVSFDARFAKEDAEFAKMESQPGVDGFMWKVDPLYKINSGHEWLLQVLFRIRITSPGRLKRSSTLQWEQRYVAKGVKLTRPSQLQEAAWSVADYFYPTLVACGASVAVSVLVALIARTAFRNSYTVTTPVEV
ncbi:Hypothetical predicted protein [Cloeon dipterum]|uniref:Cadherin domain-containing protein n=1 Tax=Cloeon dipterum TaxID=197152 RepID=A0A8S1BYG5_9INSE|nr:Hypothetical predicted protein [Cloeon dipterum]